MNPRRTTLRDIARACDCSAMTVSYALRGTNGVSGAKARRIKRVAKQLGYAPDPTLSALAAYRRAHYPKPTATPLAWVSNYATREFWRRDNFFVGHYFEGARERAREIGYDLEHFWLHEPGMTSRRMSRILYARGVSGVLLTPQPIPCAHLRFEWDKFSVVTFGYSLARPRLHMTTTNHFRSMGMIVRKLRSLGYRRIGLILNANHDLRVNHNYHAAYHSELTRLPEEYRVPTLYEKSITPVAILKWYRTHRPEVVLTSEYGVENILRGEGLRIPQDVGLALIRIEAPDRNRRPVVSGADENFSAVGVAAVDLLITLMHRNERGVPEVPRSVLIDSTWVEGLTLRRLNTARRA